MGRDDQSAGVGRSDPGRMHDQTAFEDRRHLRSVRVVPGVRVRVRARADASYLSLAKDFPNQAEEPPKKPNKNVTLLDRVLCGEADESLVAADGGGESEKGQVVAGVAFVAVVESAVAGEPGHGSLDHPPAAAKPLGGLDSLACDTGLRSVSRVTIFAGGERRRPCRRAGVGV